MKELGLNNNSFAKSIGVSPTVTFNIISGRNTKPSYDLLEKIMFTFENISAEWIIRGKGDMFTGESNITNVTKHSYKPKYLTEVPDNTTNDTETIKFLQQQINETTLINKDLTKIILNLTENKTQVTIKEPKISLTSFDRHK